MKGQSLAKNKAEKFFETVDSVSSFAGVGKQPDGINSPVLVNGYDGEGWDGSFGVQLSFVEISSWRKRGMPRSAIKRMKAMVRRTVFVGKTGNKKNGTRVKTKHTIRGKRKSGQGRTSSGNGDANKILGFTADRVATKYTLCLPGKNKLKLRDLIDVELSVPVQYTNFCEGDDRLDIRSLREMTQPDIETYKTVFENTLRASAINPEIETVIFRQSDSIQISPEFCSTQYVRVRSGRSEVISALPMIRRLIRKLYYTSKIPKFTANQMVKLKALSALHSFPDVPIVRNFCVAALSRVNGTRLGLELVRDNLSWSQMQSGRTVEEIRDDYQDTLSNLREDVLDEKFGPIELELDRACAVQIGVTIEEFREMRVNLCNNLWTPDKFSREVLVWFFPKVKQSMRKKYKAV